MPQRLTLPAPRSARALDLPSLHEPGALRFRSDALPWQRSLRWSEPPRNRRLLWVGILLAALVTLLELVGFAVGMRSYHVHAPRPQIVQVILIEPEPVLPPPPEPEPPIVTRPSRIAIAPPKVRATPPPAPRAIESSDDAMRARIGSAGPALSAPQLFNPDGSIRLGTAAAPQPLQKNPREAAKARWAEMRARGENPLDCKRTRFAKAFAPDESLGDKVSRRYLRWIGLADGEAIAHRAEQREQRAVEGCDPAG